MTRHPDGTPCRTPGAHCPACCYPHWSPPFRHNGMCPVYLAELATHPQPETLVWEGDQA